MIDEVKMGQDFLLAFRFSRIIIPPMLHITDAMYCWQMRASLHVIRR